MKIHLGDKLYKVLNDNTVVVKRVIKIKNENSFIVKEEVTGVEENISRNNIESEYTRLRPDGDLVFSVVNLEQGLKDVIVALYRRADLENNDMIPHVVCRQNVFDLFTNQINNNDKIMYVGVSVSKDTIPHDVPYEMMLACNGIHYTNKISVYIDDTFETIMSMVKESKFDQVLQRINNDVIDGVKIKGFTNTLRQLLTENNFMYDFLRTFDIYPVDITLDKDIDILTPEQLYTIEELFKVKLINHLVIPFTKEIDLKQIKRDYVLLSDLDNNLYLLAFDKGNYVNRKYANIRDKRDAAALLQYKKINK